MNLRIAVDARPLGQPMVGITRYTFELLQRMLVGSPHQWYLYLDRPVMHELPVLSNIHIREGNCRFSATSTIFAQYFFPRWAKQDNVDVFWSPRHHLPLFLAQNIKAVVTIHDLVWKFYPETMSVLGRWLERGLMPPSLARAERVITVSESTQLDLREHFPLVASKLAVVKAGLSCKDESTKLETAMVPYFLFVGTLEPRKNLPRLLNAFGIFTQTNNDTNLVLVGGEGWGKESLTIIIDRLGISDRVRLTARISEDELATYYANALALVMPSLYEGFGLPLLEAMGHGVPVITSDLGAMKEVAADAGLLIDPYSEVNLAKAMSDMLDPEIRVALSKKAVKRAADFSWDDSASEVLRQIELMFPK